MPAPTLLCLIHVQPPDTQVTNNLRHRKAALVDQVGSICNLVLATRLHVYCQLCMNVHACIHHMHKTINNNSITTVTIHTYIITINYITSMFIVYLWVYPYTFYISNKRAQCITEYGQMPLNDEHHVKGDVNNYELD